MANRKHTLSQALRDALADRGESLTEVARQTHIDLGNLSKFARGQRWLSEANLNTLAAHLGLVLVRPGGRGKLHRGVARLVLAAAVAASQAEPSPTHDALAALVGVGHADAEARVLLDQALATGKQFGSAAEILATIYGGAS